MHPGTLAMFITSAMAQEPDWLNVDPQDPTALEPVGDMRTDPFLARSPVAFYGSLTSAQADLERLLEPLRAPPAGGATVSSATSFTESGLVELARERADVDARLLVLHRQSEELERAIATVKQQRERRLALAQAGREDLNRREAQLEALATQSRSSCELAAAQLGAPTWRGARDAMSAWSELRAEVRWPEVFRAEEGMLPLHEAERELREAMEGLDESVVASLECCLAAADQEERERLALFRLRLQEAETVRPDDDELARLEELLEANRTATGRLHQRRGDIEQRQAALEAAAPDPADDAWTERALALRDQYTSLQLRLEDLPTPVDAEVWCSVHIGGALVRLAMGEDAQDPLVIAGVAFGDACQVTAAPYQDWLPFQAAWTAAARQGQSGPEATVLVRALGGVWTVDGTRLDGIGELTLHLEPGLHRVELRTRPGVTVPWTGYVEAGQHLLIAADSQGTRITVEPMRVSGAGPAFVPPPVQALDEDLGGSIGAPAPTGRVGMSLSALMMEWDEEHHLGYGLDVSVVLWQPNWGDVSLEAGAQVAFGGHEYQVIGSLSAAALPRLRLAGSARGPEGWRLRPLAEVATGLVFFRAPFVEGCLGGEYALTPTLAVQSLAGLGTSFWREGTTRLDGTVQTSIVIRL